MSSRMIFERAFDFDEEGYLTSYWEERWPIAKLLEMYFKNPVFFSVSYLNDPHGLQGNVLLVEWLKPYLPETLEGAREANGGGGIVTTGVDTGSGGTGKDPDYCAAVQLEKIGNRGFLIEKFNKRLPLEKQAQYIEDWISVHPTDFLWVEDITAKGYVWKDLQHNINGGAGSKHNFQIWTVDRKLDKQTRFLGMAPRFEAGQIMIPGYVNGAGELAVHPDWQDFYLEWSSFPAKHDDLLDAAWLAIAKSFGESEVVSFVMDKSFVMYRDIKGGELCVNAAHVARGKPITECGRCMINRIVENEREAEVEDREFSIGRPSSGLFH